MSVISALSTCSSAPSPEHRRFALVWRKLTHSHAPEKWSPERIKFSSPQTQKHARLERFSSQSFWAVSSSLRNISWGRKGGNASVVGSHNTRRLFVPALGSISLVFSSWSKTHKTLQLTPGSDQTCKFFKVDVGGQHLISQVSPRHRWGRGTRLRRLRPRGSRHSGAEHLRGLPSNSLPPYSVCVCVCNLISVSMILFCYFCLSLCLLCCTVKALPGLAGGTQKAQNVFVCELFSPPPPPSSLSPPFYVCSTRGVSTSQCSKAKVSATGTDGVWGIAKNLWVVLRRHAKYPGHLGALQKWGRQHLIKAFATGLGPLLMAASCAYKGLFSHPLSPDLCWQTNY